MNHYLKAALIAVVAMAVVSRIPTARALVLGQ